MSEETTNPSPEKSEKLFEGIRGARSRDPEVQGTAPAETGQSAEPEPKAAEGKSEEPEPKKPAGDAHLLQMKQEIAKLQRQLTQLNPWAQLGMAVGKEDRQAIERWQKGGRIFGGNRAAEEDLQDAVDSGDAPRGVSLDQINSLLDQRDAAREQLRRLNELGRENLSHFEKISKNQLYVNFLNNNLHAVWNGQMDLDPDTYGWSDEQLARNYTAMKAAHRQVLADNPKVIEAAKEAGQKEAAERAEAALAGSGHGSSKGSTSGQEEKPKSAGDEMIDRMINAGKRGRSFREIGQARGK